MFALDASLTDVGVSFRSYFNMEVCMVRRFLCVGALAIVACSGPENATAPVDDPLLTRFGKPDLVVPSGGSIQAAVDAAAAHSVIHIEPGVYAEAVTVDKPGIKLVGRGKQSGPGVVIANPGGEENGVFATADDFALMNVTVRGFEENGVLLVNVDGFLLSWIATEDNGEYGLFPVLSRNGVIEFSSATGHTDAGIYVGQSEHVMVRRSTAFANVIGFEIENSTDVKVIANESFDNTAGMLMVLLPGLDVSVSSRILVTGNDVHDNNRPNFAGPGELAAAVPTGSGILVVGPDRTAVEDNRVTRNNFVGIGVGSTLLLGALAGLPPEAFAGIEPNPDGTRVVDNVATGNGAAPPPLPLPLPGVDLLWDGSGTENCWSGNTFGTSFPAPLPPCGS